MKRNKIIYIGNFLFPHGNAGSQLVLSNGRILKVLGYDVIFIGNEPRKDYDLQLVNSEVQYEGFTLYTIPFNKSLNDIINFRSINNQTIELLKKYEKSILAVICYGSPTFALLISRIRKWCSKHKVAFVGNCVDISALSHGSIPNRVFKWLDRTILRANFKYGANGIIAVSEYINKYFSYGKKSMIILPPLVDTKLLPKPILNNSKKIRLVYAGIPFPIDGRKVDVSSYKDRLDISIELLNEVYKINKNFVFDIYGLTKEEYLKVITKHERLLEELSEVIIFHGKAKYEEIIKEVANADFTINLRDANRMTMAGFSTKFVESISCGTPSITTNTSDLQNYLEEGWNGFFIDIQDTSESIKKLNKILKYNKQEISKLKNYCYQSKLFDYRKYIEKMGRFINDIKQTDNE